MALIRRDDFLGWYREQAVDATRLAGSGAAGADRLAGADADQSGEIADAELPMLFDRLAALDPAAPANSFETERGGRPTAAGQAFDLIGVHMRQRTGVPEEPLGDRLLAEVPALQPILEGRPGAKLRRVDGRSTRGTGPLQDALNLVAAREEARRGGGYRSPLRVDFGRYRGFFGGATERAVAALQRSRIPPLPDTGVVNTATLRALEAALAEARGPATPPPGPPAPGALSSARFQSSPLFARILADPTVTLAKGSRDRAAVETLQLSLYSLGYDLGPAWVDRDFGNATREALRAFQRDAGRVDPSGELDRDTLLELDQRVTAQVAALLAAAPPLGSKQQRFRLVADISRGRTQRIFVLDKASGDPVASYLTSPGTAEHPTVGDQFTIRRTLPRRPWNPPNSPWARGLRPAPPGIDNPMGILKLDFGQYIQYIHGIPKHEIPELGRPASHGCLRTSPTNVVELHERYAEAGTDVRLNRDPAEGARLEARARALGVQDRPLDAGREYLAGYVSGELGREQAWRGGQTVIV